MSDPTTPTRDDQPARKPVLIGTGMPQTSLLEAFGQWVRDAFGHTAYHVGSSMHGKTWRDVDVRLILPDDEFDALFPGYRYGNQADAKWGLLCAALSTLGQQQTGLPIDFQIQSMTEANTRFGDFAVTPRNPLHLFDHHSAQREIERRSGEAPPTVPAQSAQDGPQRHAGGPGPVVRPRHQRKSTPRGVPRMRERARRVREAAALRASVAESARKIRDGDLTINGARRAMGLPAMDDPYGDTTAQQRPDSLVGALEFHGLAQYHADRVIYPGLKPEGFPELPPGIVWGAPYRNGRYGCLAPYPSTDTDPNGA